MKIYQYILTDKFNYHPKWIRKHCFYKSMNDDMIHYHFGIPKYVKELRKLRRKISGGTEYTFAVYGKINGKTNS